MGDGGMAIASAASLTEVVSSLLLIAGVGATVTVATVALATVAIARRVRRSPALASVSLRYRILAEAGPRREVARLRLRLWRSIQSGRLPVGRAAAGFAGETPALFRRLEREAALVDQHLRVLQVEDDAAALRAALPALRGRVAEISALAQRMRSAVAAGLAAVSDGALAELAADIDREVIALRAGRERMQELDGRPADQRWNEKEVLG